MKGIRPAVATSLGIVGLLALAACAGAPEADQLAQDVGQAMEGVQSYRFDVRFELDQSQAGGEYLQGTATMRGAFVAPDTLRLAVGGEHPIVDGAMEVLSHDGQVYVKSDDGWSEGGRSHLGLRHAAPDLKRIAEWFNDVVGNGTAEVTRADLDGEAVNHVQGNWTHEADAGPMTEHQEGAVDLWIGADDNLLRQAKYLLTTALYLPESSETPEVEVTTSGEVDFYDYNAPIEIEAP